MAPWVAKYVLATRSATNLKRSANVRTARFVKRKAPLHLNALMRTLYITQLLRLYIWLGGLAPLTQVYVFSIVVMVMVVAEVYEYVVTEEEANVCVDVMAESDTPCPVELPFNVQLIITGKLMMITSIYVKWCYTYFVFF